LSIPIRNNRILFPLPHPFPCPTLQSGYHRQGVLIATALVETGSRMDDVIFEEFKGTANSERGVDDEE